MRRLFLSLTAILVALCCFPQKIAKVAASYTYYAPETMSVEEAKRKALDNAKIQAIADEFGTLVSQSSSVIVSDKDSHFFSLGSSDVKGEWLETIGSPTYDIKFENHLLIVTCTVAGKAREIVRPAVEISAIPLRNGTDLRCEAYNFNDGDDLYLYVRSPIDGHIAVYLSDEANGRVYNILPYKSQPFPSYRISAGKEYVFFSKPHAEKAAIHETDEYTLTSDTPREYNTLYILFSPNEIGTQKSLSTPETALPKTASLLDFQSWLTKSRTKDPNFQIIQHPLTITNPTIQQ